MKKYCITFLSPGRDEYFFDGALGAKSPHLSKSRCTIFTNLKDADYTVSCIVEKNPQFVGDIQIIELTPVC